MFEGVVQEFKLLYHICFAKNRGVNHKERMENYFGPQAERYDSFRERLLHGRKGLYQRTPAPEGGIWLEIGGGTGQTLEYLGNRITRLKKVYLLDISPSLLEIAKARIQKNKWTNVECVEIDAAEFRLPLGEKADVITLTYSLSMIPSWFSVLNMAREVLKSTGQLCIVDFYVARKHPVHPSHLKQSLWSRIFWPLFFMGDDVFPNPDHLAYVSEYFAERHFSLSKGKIPYLPLRAPYYQFIGQPKRTP